MWRVRKRWLTLSRLLHVALQMVQWKEVQIKSEISIGDKNLGAEFPVK